jgi:hypothetical protein
VYGDLQTYHTAPRSKLVRGIVVRVAGRGAHNPPPPNQPSEPYQAAEPPPCFEIVLLLSPRTKSPPSSQKIEDVDSTVFQRCTAPGEFSHVEQPVAIRCRPNRH